MSKIPTARKRRANRELEELPSLFDAVDIDITREDIAGKIIAKQRRHVSEAAANQSVDINPKQHQRPDTLRYISFGSGSSGNCAYIGNDKYGLLIDAGVDNKHVEEALLHNAIDMSTIAGILLTHDHNDHVRYAYALLRKNQHMQLFCTPRCLNGLLRRHNISRRIKDYHKAIYKEIPFEAAGFTITAFETSHDGTDNVGFAIDRGEHHFVVATDMGKITDRADHYMRLANYLVIESNYDLHMLRTGRYPEHLQARIIADQGHLDNVEAAQYVKKIVSPTLRHLFLCHLSNDNNTPEIALTTMRTALEQAGKIVGDASGTAEALDADIQLTALPRYESSPLYMLRAVNK
jgi:phosphoribosyl 1,2-cyclic phosphodiesterase